MTRSAARSDPTVAAFLQDTAITRIDEHGFPEDLRAPAAPDSKFQHAGDVADARRRPRRP